MKRINYKKICENFNIDYLAVKNNKKNFNSLKKDIRFFCVKNLFRIVKGLELVSNNEYRYLYI